MVLPCFDGDHSQSVQLVEDLIVADGISCKKAVDGIEPFIEIIKETLEKGESVSLSGFGKWSVRDKNPRRGRNPKTGEEITVAERRVTTFSLSNVLRNKLSGEK